MNGKKKRIPSNDAKLGAITEREIYQIPKKLNVLLKHKDKITNITNKIDVRSIKHIYLIGAGTSYHAGFAMAYMFNRFSIPTHCEFSMEFRYLIEPILQEDDCIIALSQSGETKDTIESIKLAKDSKDCLTIAVTNNIDSTLANVCDHKLSIYCGKEDSVLATKTYINQLAVLALLALEMAKNRGSINEEGYEEIQQELDKIPNTIKISLEPLHDKIRDYSQYFKFAEFCFILGGGPDYATAMEASLKLKEGSRIFGQAYSTAEFPHGPITLADSSAWILAIIPQEEDQRKRNLIHLLRRIKERKATILGVYEAEKPEETIEPIDFGIQVPNTINDLQPILMILAVQLLTLEISRIKGINCDTPKYLSKVSGIE